MNENQVMKLSLVGSVIGLVALYFVSTSIVSPPVNIGEITVQMAGNSFALEGVVSNVFFHENGHIFFTLSDTTGEIKVVIWADIAKQLELNMVNIHEIKDGDMIGMTGVVESYGGGLEIVPLRSQIKFM